MKKALFLAAVLLCGSCSSPDQDAETNVGGGLNIVPLPVSVQRKAGEFALTSETTIVAGDEPARKVANLINETLQAKYNVALNVSVEAGASSIILTTRHDEPVDAAEEYRLKIDSKRVEIEGAEAGLFHGAQTLLQLLPVRADQGLHIPAAVIHDSPRFKYRGMHLDVARHFMPVDFIKKYIRLISRYKLNYFHWHLTDDQGWRIEIKSKPRLTEIGSRRPETVVGKNYNPYKGDGVEVGGFYTQEEIRDIVAYAAARNVRIIPEIDVPAHSSAALAAYPELGCKKNYTYKIKTTWGGFPDIICPTEESIAFVNDVIDEVADLFPGSPIHVGGDETDLTQWKESSYVQALKAREGFTTETQVVGWFMRRINEHAASRNIKLIVWDDVIPAGVDQNITIMSWHNDATGDLAAQMPNDVIMATWDWVYFDHPQSDSTSEPLGLGEPVTLAKTYAFDPIPRKANRGNYRNIIGGQGCLWTEFIKTPEAAEYMLLPRMLALSEALWSPRESKNFEGFYKRMGIELARFDSEGINYRIPEPFGFGAPARADKAAVSFILPTSESKLYYTTDGSTPTQQSNLYAGSIPLPFGTETTIKAIVVQPNGRVSSVFESVYSRLGPNADRTAPRPLPTMPIRMPTKKLPSAPPKPSAKSPAPQPAPTNSPVK